MFVFQIEENFYNKSSGYIKGPMPAAVGRGLANTTWGPRTRLLTTTATPRR